MSKSPFSPYIPKTEVYARARIRTNTMKNTGFPIRFIRYPPIFLTYLSIGTNSDTDQCTKTLNIKIWKLKDISRIIIYILSVKVKYFFTNYTPNHFGILHNIFVSKMRYCRFYCINLPHTSPKMVGAGQTIMKSRDHSLMIFSRAASLTQMQKTAIAFSNSSSGG